MSNTQLLITYGVTLVMFTKLFEHDNLPPHRTVVQGEELMKNLLMSVYPILKKLNSRRES